MPALIIDNLMIEVESGTKVIEAAERLGIMVPRFCYLKVLGSVGACRMCAVEFTAGPVRGLEMSCMVEAEEGMEVATGSPLAIDFRRQIIEWLMANHPHDCPVCDEGGQCLLQDETVVSGHGIRRYPGKKRTYRDQDLGVFVQHEMNRCIHCYRCTRFYQDYAGYRDLGAMQIGSRVYFGRFRDGALESPFSGNLVDLCPTGVYTDKPARYKRRYWDLQRAPSICPHCSLGCNTTASSDYREIIRQEARANEQVNGHFICDRGRFGLHFAAHPERPRQPRIGTNHVSWDEALSGAGDRLRAIIRANGPEAIAVSGATRNSLETMAGLLRCCRLLGWQGPHYFCNPDLEQKTRIAVAALDPSLALSMADLAERDFILIVGSDPVNEAPMLALALRQAFRKGATVAVLDPRPVSLPFDFAHLALVPEGLDAGLALLVGEGARLRNAAGAGPDPFFCNNDPAEHNPLGSRIRGQLALWAVKLAASSRPAIICGTDIVRKTTPGCAAKYARLLRKMQIDCGLFYVLAGANAFGAALMTPPAAATFDDTLAAIESGRIKALLAVETDPFFHFPDKARLERAVAKLDLLLVLDHLPTELAAKAHIFLPIANHFETGTSYINQEGRLQYASMVQSPGIPLAQLIRNGRPPRVFSGDAPGAESRPAWQVLNRLLHVLKPDSAELAPEDFFQEIGTNVTDPEVLAGLAYPADGIRIISSGTVGDENTIGPAKLPGIKQPGSLDLLLVDWTFGTEELAAYSEPVRRAATGAHLCLQAADAAEIGLAHGDRVVLHLDSGGLEICVRLSEDMARGVAILPRHHLLAWQQIEYRAGGGQPRCRVEKAADN